MVIWLQGVLLTDSRETSETAHQVLWPQSDRMKHNETWHRPNTNYHLSVIHLGYYRNLSIAVHESWFLSSLKLNAIHCAFCKNAKTPCIGSVMSVMQNESENNWASMNAKHAIEESPFRTWHSWRQVFTGNSITRCNDAVMRSESVYWLRVSFCERK